MTPKPKLLVATHNRGKLRELTDLLGDIPYEMVSLHDLGIDRDVAETGETFAENATSKAEEYCRLSGLVTLADDSGLEVDPLSGDPGVRSARYAGPNATDADRIALLLENLRDVPPESWTARFRCVIAIAVPRLRTVLYSGQCEGRIVPEPRGDNGFGYDPVFQISELGLTMAELSADQKNRVSHRAAAARQVVRSLSAIPVRPRHPRSDWRYNGIHET